jgi:glycosyltransferase involved in cell wall biosynthesis
MIPTYNSASYLRDAVESVLAQDPGAERMQIEVVDDASSDNPQAITEEYAGRVDFYEQPANVGHVANLNTCLMRSRGELVHVLHGDDAVRPGFYGALEPPFGDPTVGAAFCRYIAMDDGGRWTNIAALEVEEDGVIDDWLERIARWQRVQTPSMVVRRSVYEHIGGFDDRAGDAEDWEMWTRIAANTRVWHIVEPLALYRVRSESLSRGTLKVGQNVRNLRHVIELNRSNLPPALRDAVTREALDVTALTALRRARRLLGAGETRIASAQARQALRTSRSPAVLERTLELALIALRRGALAAARKLTRR